MIRFPQVPKWSRQRGYLGIGVRRALGGAGGFNPAKPDFWAKFDDLGAGAVDTTLFMGAGTATFTRATAATTILSTRLIGNVLSGVPRSCYTPAGVYAGYLPEMQSTNLVLQSENFGATWAAIGTPTRVAASDTCGTVVLDLIGDDDGAALEGYSQTITYTGDAVKAVSLFVKAGTSTSTVVRLRDTTAAADRLLVALAWAGGVPTPTATTGAICGVDALGNSVYRIRMLTGAVTAANTNSLQVYPATDAALAVAATGTVLAGGVQSENQTQCCTSYIPTTVATATRNSDVLTYPSAGNVLGNVGTLYCDVVQGDQTTGSEYFINLDSSAGRGLHTERSTATGRMFDGTNTVQRAGLTGSATHKVAGTYSGTSLRSFVDGVVTAGAFDGDMGVGANICIGNNSGSNAAMNPLRNVKIWKTAGTDTQVAAL